MHSFHGDDVNIHYNSDLSGDVIIIKKDTNEELDVLGKDIVAFVLERAREKKIAEVEQMSIRDLLNNL